MGLGVTHAEITASTPSRTSEQATCYANGWVWNASKTYRFVHTLTQLTFAFASEDFSHGPFLDWIAHRHGSNAQIERRKILGRVPLYRSSHDWPDRGNDDFRKLGG